MNIDYLIRKCERDVEGILNASRIFPQILQYASQHISRLNLLRMLRNAGVAEVSRVPGDAKLLLNIPVDVLEFVKRVYDATGLKARDIYVSGDTVYVYYVGGSASLAVPLKSVVECEDIGEPEEIYGMIGYRKEKLIESIQHMIDRLSISMNYIDSIYIKDYLDSLEMILGRLSREDAIGAVKSIDGDVKVVESWIRFWGSRSLFNYVLDYHGRMLLAEQVTSLSTYNQGELKRLSLNYIIYGEDTARKALEEHLREKREAEERKWRMEALWSRILDRCTNYAVRVSIDELEDILSLSFSFREEYEKMVRVVKEYCDPDNIYLVYAYEVYAYGRCRDTYVIAGISPRLPLKMLYVLRMMRDEGIDADIVRREMAGIPAPRLAIRIGMVEAHNFRRMNILVIPRKDVRVEYPCDVKVEDGHIAVIDRKALEDALRGREHGHR
jgi:hypothetical protein